MDLVRGVYNLTSSFPRDEVYGMVSQMQRAAVAIPSNIAEGYLRGHRKEYKQFLSIALSSAAELETQVLICKSIDKFKGFDFSAIELLINEVMRMLYVMIHKIES